jgi:hypothetical protein
MVKAQADREDDPHTDDLGPRVKPMDPSLLVEVEEDIHH